ncbi:transcriptional regulator (plasmid) [Allorhizobium ampelinum S4]|uniref:Transcriptional regulator n=3 Tax=Rhizobiaceae TaxID=82115 RepID=B9K550_ALLAM|nr:transcriptional regulator [Allorhizobium ampelinum S4]
MDIESVPSAQERMPMSQRIIQATLSPAHRQIADYVLDYPLRVAAMRAEELAEIVHVSVPTVNRFARALGFAGYAQFRADLVLGYETALAPVEKLQRRSQAATSPADVFANNLAMITRNIERTHQALDTETLSRAIGLILSARRISIIGLGSSAWLGGLMQRRFDLFCDDVRLLATVEGASFAARALRNVRAGDLVIAIAFPRYMADTVTLAKRMRDAGADVLALTDNASSPLVAHATMTLFAQVESDYFASCEASALALIESLSAAVSYASGRSMQAATQLVDTVLPYLHSGPNHPHRASAKPSAEDDEPELD